MSIEKESAGLTSSNTNGNIVVSSKHSGNIIPFLKEGSFFIDNIRHTKFIKNVEQQVRTSKEYSAYIRYLKTELDPPLNRCMVYSNITDDMAPIECHHGPILTLYDYVEICMGWYYANNLKFSSSRIFHTVMEEHRLNNVQVIMLSESVHVSVHNDKVKSNYRFIDYKMAHGDIVEFLNKYYLGLNYTHISKLKKYLESYQTNTDERSSFFNESITKWCDELGFITV